MESPTPQPKLEAIMLELERRVRMYRYSFGNEKELQGQLESVLGMAWPNQFRREYSLSPKDRPDFFDKELGLVVEAKMRGSFAEVFRQLMRYAEYPEVKGLVLISTKPYIGCPKTLNTKPITNINLIANTL